MKINKYLVFFLFSVKICASLLFLRIYIPDKHDEVHASDAHAYFFEGKVLNSVWDESPTDYLKLLTGIGSNQELEHKYLDDEVFHWSHRDKVYNDNDNMIRLNSVIHFFSFNSPLIHAAVFSFLSLIGFILLALFIERFSRISYRLILITLILLPSTLFWTSGILKESMVILGVGLVLSVFLKIKKSVKIAQFSVGIILMLLFKPYILLFLMPGVLIVLLYYLLPTRKVVIPVAVALFSLLVVLTVPQIREIIVFKVSKQQYDFNNISRGGIYFSDQEVIKHIDYDELDRIELSDTSFKVLKPVKVETVNYWDRMNVQYEYLAPSNKKFGFTMFPDRANGYFELTQFDSVTGMVTLIPGAMWNAFFKPLPWSPGRFNIVAFLETLFLLGLASFTIFRRSRLTKGQKAVILVCSIFFFNLIVLTGLTTPSFGAIVRYRIPAHWTLVVILFIMLGRVKQPSSISKK